MCPLGEHSHTVNIIIAILYIIILITAYNVPVIVDDFCFILLYIDSISCFEQSFNLGLSGLPDILYYNMRTLKLVFVYIFLDGVDGVSYNG